MSYREEFKILMFQRSEFLAKKSMYISQIVLMLKECMKDELEDSDRQRYCETIKDIIKQELFDFRDSEAGFFSSITNEEANLLKEVIIDNYLDMKGFLGTVEKSVFYYNVFKSKFFETIEESTASYNIGTHDEIPIMGEA